MEFTKPAPRERAPGGPFLGTVVDVVDMPNRPSQYGPQNKVRIDWIISDFQGNVVLDSKGQPITVAEFYNAILTDSSKLTKALIQILNAMPPVMNSTEQMAQLLIGRSANLFLVKAPNEKNPADPYTNIAGHSPITAGQNPPKIPANYVREINKPKTVGGIQTYATPQAAQQAQQFQPAQAQQFQPPAQPQPNFQQPPQNGYVAPQNTTPPTAPPNNTRAF
jgi:hypothetical protein